MVAEIANVGPMVAAWAGERDGIWEGVVDARKPDAAPAMWRTGLHPDPRRSWAHVSVVAIDLAQLELRAVAGTHAPTATTAEGRGYTRTGLVAAADRALLVAAFNGAPKERDGGGPWGMFIDGVTLSPAHPSGCVVQAYANASLTIAAAPTHDAIWWRQTRPCSYVQGVRQRPTNSPPDGVMRRSSIGLDEARTTLFVGIGENTTPSAIADAMHHGGAADVAPLDWAFPKFVVFAPGEAGAAVAQPLFEGFDVASDDYVSAPAVRDFFYLVRRP